MGAESAQPKPEETTFTPVEIDADDNPDNVFELDSFRANPGQPEVATDEVVIKDEIEGGRTELSYMTEEQKKRPL